MSEMFFYGTLRDREVLKAVIGHAGADLTIKDAVLPDFEVARIQDLGFPFAKIRPGATSPGILVSGLTKQDAARLTYYEAGFGFILKDLPVVCGEETMTVPVYMPPKGAWSLDGLWDLDVWSKTDSAVNVQAIAEVMDSFGKPDDTTVFQRYGTIQTRAMARVAGRSRLQVNSLRQEFTLSDVKQHAIRRPYAKFFAVQEYDLQMRRYDGEFSAVIERAAFVTGDAVTVLPYDPKTDMVMLIEQFRTGPYARAETNPWMLEPIAGRIDKGESTEETARREALEEAGIEFEALEFISGYYPSPGCLSEYLYSYVGIASLSKSSEGIHGLESEVEDIRSIVVPFDTVMAASSTGEIDNGPLLISLLWLSQNRTRLRGRFANA